MDARYLTCYPETSGVRWPRSLWNPTDRGHRVDRPAAGVATAARRLPVDMASRLREPDRQNVVVVDASSAGDADVGEQGHHLQAERLVVPVDVGPVAGSPADPRVGDAGQERRDDLVPEGEQGADDAGGAG